MNIKTLLSPGIGLASRGKEMSLKSSLHSTTASAHDLWCSLVEVYSELGLTYYGDRIVAISGVAQEFREMMLSKTRSDVQSLASEVSEYIAGLWLRDVHHGLLWQAVALGDAVALKNGAPAWSWKSIKAAVRWEDRGNIFNAWEVLNLISSAVIRYPVASRSINHSGGPLNLGLQSNDVPLDVEEYNTKNIFTCLHIRGRIKLLWIAQRS